MKIKVNGLENPVIDGEPKISVNYPQNEFCAQKAAEISVFLDGGAVYRKTVEGDERACIPLSFERRPNSIYDVYVSSVTEAGKKYSASARFRTGKLGSRWLGRWITADDARRPDSVLGAVYLRREFCAAAPCRATLFVSGLGYFEARINGEKVGDDFLSTPYTAYDKRIYYRVFDVTDMILEGQNALGLILGNGFYNCFTVDPWQSSTAPWRDVPKAICELYLEYPNGTEVIKSDRAWQSVRGPITFNGIRHGEEYDARLECEGWDMPDFSGETFPVRTPKAPGAPMFAFEAEPIRVREKFKPASRRKVKNGYLYDLRQDIAGICDITFSGKRGTEITVRYGDRLTDDGELDQSSVSGFIKNYKFQTDVYIKKSDERETWHPIFTYHGFRYIEISGCAAPPECDDIEALALCNDFDEKGKFSSSDKTVNYIQRMCIYSTTSCCFDTFVSDTAREKSSWTGDTGLSVEQLLINFSAENLMTKWQTDLRDAMRPAGGLPCIVPTTGWGFNSINGPDWSHPVYEVPLRLYMMTGDVSHVSDNIETIKRHCDYVASMAEDDGTICYGLGDWCAPFEGAAISKNMETFKCPIAVSDTAFYYSALQTLIRFAEILGRRDITEEYTPLALATRDAFRHKFFDKNTFTVAGDCQSATGIAVYHGLCDDDETAFLGERLCEQIRRDGNRLDFGVLGMKAVLDTLGKTGHTDVALNILTQPEYPSMKHWIDMGATTLWECWNGQGSHNHHMFSAVSAFFYKYVGGVSYAAPSGKELEFRPGITSGLSSANAYIDTPWGRAECLWKISENTANIDITVPSSCVGTLILPNEKRTLCAGKHKITV